MTDIVLFVDAEDFEVLPEENYRSGAVTYDSVDSARNWASLLTGEHPVNHGVISKYKKLDESDLTVFSELDTEEKAFREKSPSLTAHSDLAEESLYEKTAEIGKTGVYFSFLSYPGVEKVDDCIPLKNSSFDFLSDEFQTTEKSMMDVKSKNLVRDVQKMFEKKIETVEKRIKEHDLEIVFVSFCFSDILGHRHLEGYSDDLLLEVVDVFSKYENLVMVSDHGLSMNSNGRKFPKKHSLPGRYMIKGGEGNEPVSPEEMHEKILEVIKD